MPISVTQGKELVFETRNGQKVNLEMGRAYFIKDPNNGESPLAQVCPPQLTTVLCIPIGVDKNKEYMVRFFAIGVDSREYAFNKRDDHNVHVVSKGHAIVLNYEILLDIFDRVDNDHTGRNTTSYMGTIVAINPWILNVKKFHSLEPTEIKLFDMSRVPRRFLKYFFGYPHHNVEATKRSKFPSYEDVTRGISPRLTADQKKRMMLEKFHQLFAMLNVNNAAKLEGANRPHPVLSIIPFIRRSSAHIQEVALAIKAPNILCIKRPEDDLITLRITITDEEYDRIGRSVDMFTKCGVVFHIGDQQLATVPYDVYDGNPPYHIRGVSRIRISEFHVKGHIGNLIGEGGVTHYVLDGRDPQVRQYIHNQADRWDENGPPAVRTDQIVDLSNGDGYTIQEAHELADLNGERLQQLRHEEMRERLAADGDDEEDEYDDEEEDYPEDAAEPEAPEPQAIRVDVNLENMEWGAVNLNERPRQAEFQFDLNEIGEERPQNPENGEPFAVRGEMRVLENCHVVSYDPDHHGSVMQGGARVQEDEPEPPDAREELMGNSDGRIEPVTVFKANFARVENTAQALLRDGFAVFKMEVDEEWPPEVIERVGGTFPMCIFKFFNVETAVFNSQITFVVPGRGDGEMSFILIRGEIADDPNIERMVNEVGGIWLGATQVVFYESNVRRERILMGEAVLLPRANQLKADLLTIIRTSQALRDLNRVGNEE